MHITPVARIALWVLGLWVGALGPCGRVSHGFSARYGTGHRTMKGRVRVSRVGCGGCGSGERGVRLLPKFRCLLFDVNFFCRGLIALLVTRSAFTDPSAQVRLSASDVMAKYSTSSTSAKVKKSGKKGKRFLDAKVRRLPFCRHVS